MSVRVKSERYGIIHYIAQCQQCDWECGIRTSKADIPQDVRNQVYSHVRKTGHVVHVEGGTSTDYSLDNFKKDK